MVSILDSVGSSLLSAGRNLAVSGFGISAGARAINEQLISTNSAGFDKLFSLAAGNDSNIDGAKIIINGLRAQQPESGLSRSLRGENVDTQV